MRNIIYIILLCLFICKTYGQQAESNEESYKINCIETETYESSVENISFISSENRANKTECEKIGVRIVVHFMLKNDGSGNFTEIDDGMGGPLTGYQFATDMVRELNYQQSQNVSMNLPPHFGQNTPLPKSFHYILEGIYFHRDDNYYNYGAAFNPSNPYLVKNDSIVNVFFVSEAPHNECRDGGRASFSSNIIEMKDFHCLVQNYVYPPNWWYPYGLAHTLGHELGHILGLQHPSRKNLGQRMPVIEMGVMDNTGECTDYQFTTTDSTFYNNYLNGVVNGQVGVLPIIDDALNPWHIYKQYGYTCHPACYGPGAVNWNPNWNKYCSNNLMDYNGQIALTDDQIARVHYHLENTTNKVSTKTCNLTSSLKHFCSFSYPITAYYGSEILVDNCNANGQNIVSDETTIIFSEEVVIDNIEIVADIDKNSFEIVYDCNCD